VSGRNDLPDGIQHVSKHEVEKDLPDGIQHVSKH
jgi:hypothetical protein